MRTGDILNVHNPFVWYNPIRWVGWGIQKVTRSFYNHTAIVLLIWGSVYVAEAKAKGITITPFGQWKQDKVFEVKRPSFDIDEKKIAVRIMSKQGFTGYDFGTLFFYQLIFQVTGHWLGTSNKEKAQKRLVCSEYIAWIYDLPEFWKATPKSISESNNFTTIN